jgi:outer membrane immunogenic protein
MASTGNFSGSGAIFGGTVGKNWAAGQMVFGVEADLSATDIKAVAAGGLGCTGCATALDWLGTLRGRAGFVATPEVLLFASGGLGIGGFTHTYALQPAFSHSATSLGWTAGGGVEVALSQNWTAKAEYLYFDLGSQVACPPASTCGSGTVINSDYFHTQIVRVGLNWQIP